MKDITKNIVKNYLKQEFNVTMMPVLRAYENHQALFHLNNAYIVCNLIKQEVDIVTVQEAYNIWGSRNMVVPFSQDELDMVYQLRVMFGPSHMLPC